MRTRIKICGVTRHEDAEAAVRLGADAVGFVLWPSSPRAVSPEAARDITRRLPPLVTRVGVFVDADPDDVARAVLEIGLDVAQLHGQEDVTRFVGCGARITKAIALDAGEDIARGLALPGDVMPLVDASDRIRHGGTGRVANWQFARALAEQRAIALAGGLTPENVGSAIDAVRPWAIDVASGVERAPGIKDGQKLAALFAAVGAADRRKA